MGSARTVFTWRMDANIFERFEEASCPPPRWSTPGDTRGHQPFRNCELILVDRLMRRATSLIHTSEVKILLNSPSIILILIFVNAKTLIMLILFLEKARGRPTWSLRATWCPRAPRWWPLVCTTMAAFTIELVRPVLKCVKSFPSDPSKVNLKTVFEGYMGFATITLS